MIWQSWRDFFSMGGYGLYVWGSVAAIFVIMIGEIAALRMRRHAALRALGRLLRATQNAEQKTRNKQ